MTPTHYCAGALPDTVCVQGHHLTLLHCISLIMLFSSAITIRDGMHRLYSLYDRLSSIWYRPSSSTSVRLLL